MNKELNCFGYLAKKKVGFRTKTDSTESWFVRKNGRKVARNLVMCYLGGSTLLWKGWYTRLDKVGNLLNRLSESRNRFWATVAKPELMAHLGTEEKAEVYYCNSEGFLSFVSIHQQREYDGSGISYSARNTAQTSDMTPLSVADIVQTKGWDTHYKGWDNNFKDGTRLISILTLMESKWSRYFRVKTILTHLVFKKLEEIAAEYKTGDIIEFNCGSQDFRFEKKSYPHNKVGYWEEISARPIQRVDISAIIPKYP